MNLSAKLTPGSSRGMIVRSVGLKLNAVAHCVLAGMSALMPASMHLQGFSQARPAHNSGLWVPII